MTLRVKPSSEGPVTVSFSESEGLKFRRGNEPFSNAPSLDDPAVMLLYSIGSCMAISVQRLAKRRKVDINPFQIRVIGHKGLTLPAHFASYELELSRGVHPDIEIAQLLLKDAKKICTIGNSVSGTFELTIES